MLRKKSIILTLFLLVVTVTVITGASMGATTQSDETENATEQSITMSFSDVTNSDWFYEDVKYVNEKKLMTGTSDTTFSPNIPTTRGMIVTILWRIEGEPISSGNNHFKDVKNDLYYYTPVIWAAENNIVSGYDDVTFGADDNITREQLATILYRYTSYKGCDVTIEHDLTAFADKNEISEYAVNAMTWANFNQIITGTTTDKISPKDTATRCQVAAVLKRWCENILAETNPDNKVENNQNEDEKNTEKDNTSSNTSSGGTSTPPIGAGSSPSDEIEEPTIDSDVADNERPTIKVNTSYGNPGDIISVKIDIQNNPGVLGMILSLEYDEEAMRLINVENGNAVSDILTLTPSRELNSGVKFVWDGIEISDSDIQDGNILTLEFEIFDSAVFGKRYPLKLEYTAGDIVDADLNEVAPKIIQGFVEIEQENKE